MELDRRGTDKGGGGGGSGGKWEEIEERIKNCTMNITRKSDSQHLTFSHFISYTVP